MKPVFAYDRHFANKELKELPVSEGLVNKYRSELFEDSITSS
jgi:hypothetical protein